MKKIKKILNKNEFWMGIFTLTTTWWLFNVGVWSSLVMIIPLLIAVPRPWTKNDMLGEVMLHNILNDMVGTSDPQRNEDVNEEKNIWKKEKVK